MGLPNDMVENKAIVINDSGDAIGEVVQVRLRDMQPFFVCERDIIYALREYYRTHLIKGAKTGEDVNPFGDEKEIEWPKRGVQLVALQEPDLDIIFCGSGARVQMPFMTLLVIIKNQVKNNPFDSKLMGIVLNETEIPNPDSDLTFQTAPIQTT